MKDLITELRFDGIPSFALVKKTEEFVCYRGYISTGEILTTNNYFRLPNDIFNLNLCAGEIAVYSFLLRMENRRTFTCFPSYKTIGKALKMSKNTVAKYIHSLEDKHLIELEQTTVLTRKGLKRNGNYQYKNLIFSEQLKVEIGIWSERRLRYIEKYHKKRYTNLLKSCELTAYLADIDKQSGDMFFRLVNRIKVQQRF